MRPKPVAVHSEVGYQHRGLGKRVELGRVQQLVADPGVEGLDLGVLPRCPFGAVVTLTHQVDRSRGGDQQHFTSA